MFHFGLVDSLSKYDLKQIQRKRLSEAMQTGLKVAIDCSFEDTLSPKVQLQHITLWDLMAISQCFKSAFPGAYHSTYVYHMRRS